MASKKEFYSAVYWHQEWSNKSSELSFLRHAIAPLVEAMNQSDLGTKKKWVLVGLNTADLKKIKKAYEGA